MTITIPTYELVTGLAEALQFAAADKKAYWHGVLIAWDGDRLHFSGYDTLAGARISWSPGEGVESRAEEQEGRALPMFGGDDYRWSVFLSVPSAMEIIKTYKLPAKLGLVPLMLKCTPTGSSLIVERSRDTGQSQHLGMWPSDPDRAAKMPEIAAVAEISEEGDSKRPFFSVSPSRLGAFGAAARHGVMTMTFSHAGSPIAARAGSTFVGFLYEAGERPVSLPRSSDPSFLRDASGVHVSGSRPDEDR